MVIVSYTRRIVTTNLCRGYGVRKADRNMGANELVNYAFLSRDGAKKLAESLFFFFSFLFTRLSLHPLFLFYSSELYRSNYPDKFSSCIYYIGKWCRGGRSHSRLTTCHCTNHRVRIKISHYFPVFMCIYIHVYIHTL